jgi:hypothetical protein
MRAMKAPPRKLLKQEKKMRAIRPGTPRTMRRVPRMSTPLLAADPSESLSPASPSASAVVMIRRSGTVMSAR